MHIPDPQGVLQHKQGRAGFRRDRKAIHRTLHPPTSQRSKEGHSPLPTACTPTSCEGPSLCFSSSCPLPSSSTSRCSLQHAPESLRVGGAAGPQAGDRAVCDPTWTAAPTHSLGSCHIIHCHGLERFPGAGGFVSEARGRLWTIPAPVTVLPPMLQRGNKNRDVGCNAAARRKCHAFLQQTPRSLQQL